MNPPSPLAANGPILSLANRENPVVPPSTPRVETPGRQSTLEDRMEALQREMTRMQEHNNILSSKLDDTQKQLHEQQSHLAQLQDGLEQTTQLWRERSLKSIPRPSSGRTVRLPKTTSPIPVQAKLNDWHLDILGPKSPLRRRYDVVSLEETDKSDYIPTSLHDTLTLVDNIWIGQKERLAARTSDGGLRGTRTRSHRPLAARHGSA
ncbi:unnamed protein product [Prunus armeniaca]